MKFLIDRCAGHRLAEWLRSLGHDVVEAIDLGRDPGDSALLSTAQKAGRIVITIDTDFGKLIFADDEQHSGLVRLPSVPAQSRIALMEQILVRHEADLLNGAIITVRGNRIRITRRGGP